VSVGSPVFPRARPLLFRLASRDKKVFSKVAARVGMERVRLMITGSAPIAAHVMDFLRIVFRCVAVVVVSPAVG
jgi:long-subunit acyl-CoA synthetase (AMP-forming)